MDDLPKNNPNDWSSFAGLDPAKPATDQPQTPPGETSGDSTVVENSSLPPVETPPQPVMQTVPEPFASEPTATQPPTEGTIPQTTEVENPFVIPAQTPPKDTGGTRKRLLIFGILIVILLLVGVIGFKVIGGLATKNQPLTLTYWGLWENEQILAPIIAEYKKTHPNVEIVYSKQSPKQYRERLQAAIGRGEGPDLFRFHNTWVPMLKDDLSPAAKTGYSAAEFQSTFYPVANKDLVIGGRVYGAPLEIDGLGLYYNEDLLRAAGVTPPSSWDDLLKSAESTRVPDQTGQGIVTAGVGLGLAANIEHFSDILALMMLQNGADLKNPKTKEAVDSLSFYRLFVDRKFWDETQDNSIVAFANGKVAMIFAPSWEVHTVRQLNPQLKFQIVPVPQLPGTNVTWASYWVEGVSSKSKHADAAWEFLKFLTSKESEITLYTEASKERTFGEPYSRVDLAQTVINDPYVGAYIRQAQTAQSFFLVSRTFDNGINDRMIKYLEDAVNSLSKGVSSQAAMETASAGFTQVLTSFGATALK